MDEPTVLPVLLFVDIDVDISKEEHRPDLDPMDMIETSLRLLSLYGNAKGAWEEEYDPFTDWAITTASSPSKLSFHATLRPSSPDKFTPVFPNAKSLDRFMRSFVDSTLELAAEGNEDCIKTTCRSGDKSIFDKGIYTRNRLIRMPLNYKRKPGAVPLRPIAIGSSAQRDFYEFLITAELPSGPNVSEALFPANPPVRISKVRTTKQHDDNDDNNHAPEEDVIFLTDEEAETIHRETHAALVRLFARYGVDAQDRLVLDADANNENRWYVRDGSGRGNLPCLCHMSSDKQHQQHTHATNRQYVTRDATRLRGVLVEYRCFSEDCAKRRVVVGEFDFARHIAPPYGLTADTFDGWRENGVMRVVNQQFIDLAHELSDRKVGTLLVRSPMGTGKTKSMREWLTALVAKEPRLSAMYVSCRIMLAKATHDHLSESIAMTMYNEEGIEEDLGAYDRVVVTLDSIWRNKKRPRRIVIFDESESLLASMSSSTLEGKRADVIEQLRWIAATADVALFLDADLGERTVAFARQTRSMRDEGFRFLYNARHADEQRYSVYAGGYLTWHRQLLADAEQGARIFVATNSKAEADYLFISLRRAVPSLNALLITADSPAEHKQADVNVLWAAHDVVIASPAVGAGMDFNIRGHFDKKYIYAQYGSSSPRDTRQQIGRVRHTNTGEVHLFLPPGTRGGRVSLDDAGAALRARDAARMGLIVDYTTNRPGGPRCTNGTLRGYFARLRKSAGLVAEIEQHNVREQLDGQSDFVGVLMSMIEEGLDKRTGTIEYVEEVATKEDRAALRSRKKEMMRILEHHRAVELVQAPILRPAEYYAIARKQQGDPAAQRFKLCRVTGLDPHRIEDRADVAFALRDARVMTAIAERFTDLLVSHNELVAEDIAARTDAGPAPHGAVRPRAEFRDEPNYIPCRAGTRLALDWCLSVLLGHGGADLDPMAPSLALNVDGFVMRNGKQPLGDDITVQYVSHIYPHVSTIIELQAPVTVRNVSHVRSLAKRLLAYYGLAVETNKRVGKQRQFSHSVSRRWLWRAVELTHARLFRFVAAVAKPSAASLLNGPPPSEHPNARMLERVCELMSPGNALDHVRVRYQSLTLAELPDNIIANQWPADYPKEDEDDTPPLLLVEGERKRGRDEEGDDDEEVDADDERPLKRRRVDEDEE